MELTETTSTPSDTSVNETQYPGDDLFQELLACNPCPTIDQLIDLLQERNINPSKIVRAVVRRSDFDIENHFTKLLATLTTTSQIESTWSLIPESFLTHTTLYQSIGILSELGARAHKQSLVRAGRLFLDCPTSDTKELDIRIVIERIPMLRNEAWDRLVELEAEKPEPHAIQQLVWALKYIVDDDAKQKGLWMLERYPSCAKDLITHSNPDISKRAAEIILDKPELEYPAIGQILSLYIFRDTDIPARATQKAFRAAEAGDIDVLLHIIHAQFATMDDRIRAADLFIPVCSDIPALDVIMDMVPARREQARLRKEELIQVQETNKTTAQRLIEQIHQLGPRKLS